MLAIASNTNSLLSSFEDTFSLEDFEVHEQLAVLDYQITADISELNRVGLVESSIERLEYSLESEAYDFANFSLEADGESVEKEDNNLAQKAWNFIKRIAARLVSWFKDSYASLVNFIRKARSAFKKRFNSIRSMPEGSTVTYQYYCEMKLDHVAFVELADHLKSITDELNVGGTPPDSVFTTSFGNSMVKAEYSQASGYMLSSEVGDLPLKDIGPLTRDEAMEELSTMEFFLIELNGHLEILKGLDRKLKDVVSKAKDNDMPQASRASLGNTVKLSQVAVKATSQLVPIIMKGTNARSTSLLKAAKNPSVSTASVEGDIGLESAMGLAARAGGAAWRAFTNNWSMVLIGAIQTTTSGLDAIHTEYDRIFDSLPDHEGEIMIKAYPPTPGAIIDFLNTVKSAGEKGNYKKSLKGLTIEIGPKTYGFNEKGKLEETANSAKEKMLKFNSKKVDLIRRDLYKASNFRWKTAIIRDLSDERENIQTNRADADVWHWGDVAETTHKIAKAYLAESKRLVAKLKAET